MTRPDFAATSGPPGDAAAVLLGGPGDGSADDGAAFVCYLPAAGPGQRLDTDRHGSRSAVFEGWLHRREDLASAVDLPEASGDAELVTAAFARWGTTCFAKLDGAFVFCIVDDADGGIVVARDPIGVVPLFYTHVRGRLFLSPSVETLRRHPLVSAAVNRVSLATHLLAEGRDVTRSFYDGIHRLLPGHVLRGRAGSETTDLTRFWSPLHPAGRPRWLHEREVDRFPSRLSDAIERHLRLGRAGIFLSGGLDSGTVATLAADTARAGGYELPHAFSLVLDDPEANEERVQRGVAAGLGLPHTLVPLNLTTDPIEAFAASLALNDDWPHPLASTFRSVYLALGRRAVADGCELILTGDGGDEWLAVHPTLAADLLRSMDPSALRAMLDTVRTTHGMSPLRAGRHVLWEHGAKLLAVDAAARATARLLPGTLARRRRGRARKRLPDWFAPDRSVRDAVLDRIARPAATPSAYHAAIVRDTLEHPLSLLYLEESFESGRRIGAPILKPFYHPRVVAFLARTPPWLRSQGGQFKGLLRAFLHERHPQLGFDRQRKPYATNFHATMVLRGLQRDWPGPGGLQALSDLGVVDGPRVDAIIAETLDRGTLADLHGTPKHLWMLLCSERWVRSRNRV